MQMDMPEPCSPSLIPVLDLDPNTEKSKPLARHVCKAHNFSVKDPMPWSPAQHRLFKAAAHNSAIAREHGMTPQKASSMAHEGIKPSAKQQALAHALRTKR